MGSAVSAKEEGRSEDDNGGDDKSSSSSYYRRREAHHAGSWYDDDADRLSSVLEGFLGEATASTDCDNGGGAKKQQQQVQGRSDSGTSTSSSGNGRLRGLIVPHAGYSYSGPTAAYSYAALRNELLAVRDGDGSGGSNGQSPIRRILVLHPSHHVYLDGCAVSGGDYLETPVGALKVDDELRKEVLALGCGEDGDSNGRRRYFSIMEKRVDEMEHSGEMQYPYLAHILNNCGCLDRVPVLPIMCGALSEERETLFGNLLSEIVARRDVLTVVSTDFCHWGSRFSFKAMPPKTRGGGPAMPIHDFIEQLDRRGMDLIEMKEPGAFARYLRETQNTICGRHAVAVWLRAVTAPSVGDLGGGSLGVRFVRYAQSSPAKSARDSSVSYAAAVAHEE